MSKRLLLVLMLAVPAAGVGVSILSVWGIEREWQSGLEKEFPDSDVRARAEFTLARACTDPRVAAAVTDACSIRSYDDMLRIVSMSAALLGISWLVIIYGVGLIARRSRTLLLHFFVPGLHLTNLVAVVLILASASIAIASVPLLMMTFGGRWPVKIFLVLVVVAIGALGGIVAMVKASFSVVRKTMASVLGKLIAEKDAPALWKVVRDVSSTAGAEPPDNLVVGLEPNFFVTEAPVRCADGQLGGRTMFVSLPLCRILRLDEVRAVLGHEMAHFVGLDTKFSRKFFPVYRGTALALQGLASTGSDGAASLALLPAVSLLSFFFDSFAAAESNISRGRELVADRGGARVTSADVMATALVKVHAFSDAWSAAEDAMAEALRERKLYKNASVLFADLVVSNASPKHLVGLDERQLAHPTDSHPPLASRLASLGTSLSEVGEQALNVNPEDAAIGVVDACDQLERDLSEVEQLLLARKLGIDLSAGDDDAKTPAA